MKQFSSLVQANERVADGYYQISFNWPESLAIPIPGQFVTIRNEGGTDPLLRRPFAIAGFDESHNSASIIYQIRGQGTRNLAAQRSGETMDVLGPLGNSFPNPEDGTAAVLIAGGIGFGPIYYLSQVLADRAVPSRVVIGARTVSLIPEVDYTSREHLATYSFCTDDGSLDFKGTVVDYLKSIGLSLDEDIVLYACGPSPMLEGCSSFAAERDLKCYVSLEQVMGCGVGACMGCAIRVKEGNGYARVCTDGPVFDSESIVWK